jgi:hypothetical protein
MIIREAHEVSSISDQLKNNGIKQLNMMKNVNKLFLILMASPIIFLSCDKDDDAVAQIECNRFETGKNVIMDAAEKEIKCVYGFGGYSLLQDSFGEDGESIEFRLDVDDFIVTFYTYESSVVDGSHLVESNGVFEAGSSYEADARTGNATFFSPATLEITSIDKENELISGKITSKAPIKWVDATPVMGYVIFTFTDLGI